MEQNKTWYSVSLGDGMWAPTVSEQIEEKFRASFEEAGKPLDMAVFTRSESEGRLHCEVIAYFSPAAWNAAMVFDAKPCEKPLRDGLGLLAGDSNSWAVFFAESKS